jgi:LPS export ABC transporter protein LptC
MELPNTGTIFRFSLLSAATVLSTVVFLQTREPEVNPLKARLSLAYYLDSAELKGTGPDGETLYEVRTGRASHVVADDSIAMDEDEMVYSPNGPQAWNLTANTGRIPADASVIELNGNVKIQSGSGNSAATTISTEQLELNPATRQARTQDAVVVDYDGQLVNATGLEADLKRNRLKLLSNVHGDFTPDFN